MTCIVYMACDGVMRALQGFRRLDKARKRRKLLRQFQINLECVMSGQPTLLEERRDQPGKARMQRFQLTLAPDSAQSFHAQDGTMSQFTAFRRLLSLPQCLDGATGTDFCRF